MQAGSDPGGRVLVVAESGYEPLVRALTAEGHAVDTRLPASALGPPPDVVVAVRASSGAAVLAALERRHRLPVAPVIVLSGAVPAGERAGLLRAGAHTCLPDPVHPDELLAAVAGALAMQRSRNASAEAPEGLLRLGHAASATGGWASASSTCSSRARRATATRSPWSSPRSTASTRAPQTARWPGGPRRDPARGRRALRATRCAAAT